MPPVIDNPRVLTRPRTAVDKAALTLEKLMELLEKSKSATPRPTLSTASATFMPAAWVFIPDSASDDPWFGGLLDEQTLEPWRLLEESRSLPEQVQALTSGTKPTSTTVTLIRRLLRLYRDGRESLFERQTDLKTLAAEQGVQPTFDLTRLRGDFWPEDEEVDEFIAQVRRWRTAESKKDDPS